MTEDQRIAELLKPRYKVIADYPGSPFWVGSILIFIPRFMHRVDGNIESTTYSDVFRRGNHFILADEIKEYPHLFNPLEWYEDRKPEEMPGYVKDKFNQVHKVTSVERIGANLEKGFYAHWKNVQPATLAEYTQYINSKQQP